MFLRIVPLEHRQRGRRYANRRRRSLLARISPRRRQKIAILVFAYVLAAIIGFKLL